MKIQIDTKNKTIQIEEDINLSFFMDEIKSILRDEKIKEYTLKSEININRVKPFTITPNTPINPYQPIGVPNTNPYDPMAPSIWYHTTTNNSGN